MPKELAETGNLQPLLARIGAALDGFLRFVHPDPMTRVDAWRGRLDTALPEHGIGIDMLTSELIDALIPHGSALAKPGFSSFITAGGTTAGTLASTAASIASPQRYSLTAFNFLEDLSLRWLADMFQLGPVQGVYSSGGSVANLLALGAARQYAFERVGRDPAAHGVDRPAHIYATHEAHHTVQRSAGVLGIGRRAVKAVACDSAGRMSVDGLRTAIAEDLRSGVLPVAIVANVGTTNAGAIDPLADIAAIAREHGIWLHADGAYGLPGILDPRKAPLYAGLEQADSVIMDPHKWLGAATGVAATFVRDGELLRRAFTQEPADYLQASGGAASAARVFEHSLEDLGTPYYDYGVELSAPCRGVVVWALIREIGVEGMRARIVRHNDMALRVADSARRHPNLELLLDPTLSICCFRYVAPGIVDLDGLNQLLHRRLIRENRNLPSTTRIDGKFALRPCFVGARCDMENAEELVSDVLRIGAQAAKEFASQ